MPKDVSIEHGRFIPLNATMITPVSGVLRLGDAASYEMQHVVNGGSIMVCSPYLHCTQCRFSTLGCFRDPSWPWWRQPVPWWTLFFLVPMYSTCSSLCNLQSYRSWQLPVMVVFSCASFAANQATSLVLPGRSNIVSAAGALVIGGLGNLYSRIVRGTAFTSMVTGVLFLVPVSHAEMNTEVVSC